MQTHRSRANGMTHNTRNTLHIEEDKHSALEQRPDVHQIILECEVTEYLKKEVERCNLRLKNFQLRLVMEI
jgi:hypothetical protein